MDGLHLGSRWWLRAAALVPLLAAPVAPGGPPAARAAAPATQLLDVSAGAESICALLSDGTLRCWGYDWDDEPVPDPPDGTFTTVSSGASFWCAIRDDGTLACWGQNDWYQARPPSGTFKALDAGWDHACAITTEGTLACWGRNNDRKRVPPAGPDTYTAVSVGQNHACAIRASDQAVVCWGSDEAGESDAPDGRYVAVSAGVGSQTCAIDTDGKLTCWGYNGYGVAEPPDGTFTAVSAGQYHSCAIQADGTLACWGADWEEFTPPEGEYISVSAGAYPSCAIRTDHTLNCWGWPGMPRPEISVSPISRWRAEPEVALSWIGTPALADIASYDVRYKRAKWNGGFGDWQRLPATTTTELTVTAEPGYTYCFQVRARDGDENVSWWSGGCTSIPLDDRALTRAGRWTAKTGAAFYLGTALRSSKQGATLTRAHARFSRVALVATTCPTCGQVNVYFGSKLLRSINLTSATRAHRTVILVKNWWTHKGTLRIVVASSGKPVIIDGLAIYR